MQSSDPETAREPDLETDIGVDIEEAIFGALARNDREAVLDAIGTLHYADIADFIERLSKEDRKQFVSMVRDALDHEVLSELDEMVREEVVSALDDEAVAVALTELDSDDAVQVIEDLDPERQQSVLDQISDEERTLIEEALSYPEDSAGRLMQREVATVPSHWNVGQCIDYLRREAESDNPRLPTAFYDIFLTDPRHHPVGAVGLSELLRSRRQIPLSDVASSDLHAISVTTDQEEIAFLFRQRDLVSAPVINADGRLVGAITVDDVVDIIDEEHEEDLMRMGGVTEGDLYRAAISTTRTRFSWLVVNLITAVLASIVIGLFDATIEQVVALAVLMPIVASMGGNAGTQTLTVTVRALATKELTASNALRVVNKELIVGALNGVIFAALAGGVAWTWFSSPVLGGVIAAAMIINMFVAGLAGTAIPIALDRMGADPAIASSVFLTTVTDVVGFFAFLGLAAIVLL